MSDKGHVVSNEAGNSLATAASPSDGVLGAAVDSERRAALAEILDHEPIGVSALAARIVARQHDCSLDAVSDAERDRTAAALHHSHLPRLADDGLVELDRDGDSVVVRSPGADLTALERIEALAEHEHGDSMLAVLSDADRRHVARVLSRTDGPDTVSTLAESIAARKQSSMESARISLHHVHLPKLDDVGLLEYDEATRRVESVDFPEPLLTLLPD